MKMSFLVQPAHQHLKTASSTRMFFYILSVSFISHLLYYFVYHIRFDSSSLTFFWQFLDIKLLRDNLLESVWYLHGQPPLYNLFLGTVLKYFPQHSEYFFQGVYVSLGVILTLGLFKIQCGLGISPAVAFFLTLMFVSSPSFILYEHFLFYTFPMTTVLTSSVLFVFLYLTSHKNRYLAGLYVMSGILVMTRSLFHLVGHSCHDAKPVSSRLLSVRHIFLTVGQMG